MYRTDGAGPGSLIVDNGGGASFEDGTTVRHVGRHRIGAVESLGDGLWKVSPERFAASLEGTLAAPDQPGSIAYHPVVLERETRMRTPFEGSAGAHVAWYRDDGGLDVGDRVRSSTLYPGSAASSFTLPAGRYLVAVAGRYTTDEEIVLGRGGFAVASGDPLERYEVRIEEGDLWTPSAEADGGYGLQGLTVSLDADDADAPLHPVVSNDGTSLVVRSEDDPGEAAGAERVLIGVHVLDTLRVGGGASVSFGDDRLELLRPGASGVEAGSRLRAGELGETARNALLAGRTDGELSIERLSPPSGALVLLGGDWRIGALALESLALADGAVLKADRLTVSGEARIGDASVLVVPDVSVDGDLTLESGSGPDGAGCGSHRTDAASAGLVCRGHAARRGGRGDRSRRQGSSARLPRTALHARHLDELAVSRRAGPVDDAVRVR